MRSSTGECVVPGGGGVDGAIHRAAGSELLEAVGASTAPLASCYSRVIALGSEAGARHLDWRLRVPGGSGGAEALSSAAIRDFVFRCLSQESAAHIVRAPEEAGPT